MPTQGDQLDEMFAQSVNACPYHVHIVRHGDGKYTYGSLTIYLQIMQEEHQKKLIVRVNGGFMLVEDFLKKYAEGESRADGASMSMSQTAPPKKANTKVSPRRSSPKGYRAGSPGMGGSLR